MEHLTTAQAIGLGLLFFAVFYMGYGVGKVHEQLRSKT